MFDIVQKYSIASKIVLGIIGLTFVVAGGVGANMQLRHRLNTLATQHGFSVHYPELHLCTDNGAMIAFAGSLAIQKNPELLQHHDTFTVLPRCPLRNTI